MGGYDEELKISSEILCKICIKVSPLGKDFQLSVNKKQYDSGISRRMELSSKLIQIPTFVCIQALTSSE